MRRLLELADAALDADERCMLCSVVRLDGSGYGRVGARLLLTDSGDREGYISGGCLEKDLMRRVWTEASRSPRLMAFDTRSNMFEKPRYNTGCQGIVYVLCQPFDRGRPFFMETLARVVEQRQSVRLLTIYRSQWSEYRAGDALAKFTDGSLTASSMAMQDAGELLSLLDDGRDAPFTAAIEDGDGALLELTVEVLTPPKRLVIFGSGDDVQPLVRTALSLGWEVWVMGQRPESTTKARFPGAKVYQDRYVAMPFDQLADPHTHVLLMTHDLNSDLEILPLLADANVGSIGALGSKRRLARMVTQLEYRGIHLNAGLFDRIRCPIGLDIGASSPEEIAVAIVAELIALERGNSCRPLSDVTGSIHAPVPHIHCRRNKPVLSSGA